MACDALVAGGGVACDVVLVAGEGWEGVACDVMLVVGGGREGVACDIMLVGGEGGVVVMASVETIVVMTGAG